MAASPVCTLDDDADGCAWSRHATSIRAAGVLALVGFVHAVRHHQLARGGRYQPAVFAQSTSARKPKIPAPSSIAMTALGICWATGCRSAAFRSWCVGRSARAAGPGSTVRASTTSIDASATVAISTSAKGDLSRLEANDEVDRSASNDRVSSRARLLRFFRGSCMTCPKPTSRTFALDEKASLIRKQIQKRTPPNATTAKKLTRLPSPRPRRVCPNTHAGRHEQRVHGRRAWQRLHRQAASQRGGAISQEWNSSSSRISVRTITFSRVASTLMVTWLCRGMSRTVSQYAHGC